MITSPLIPVSPPPLTLSVGFKKDKALYKLYAISHHSGSLYGGHYVADAIRQGKWHHFNDSCVSSGEPASSSSSAYVLFYARGEDARL